MSLQRIEAKRCLSLIVLFGIAQTLSIKINDKETHCFEVETVENSDLKINYQVSGERQENVKFLLYSEQGVELHSTDMRAEYKYTYKSNEKEIVKVCFQCQDRKEKTINFLWKNRVDTEFVGIDDISQAVKSAEAANRKLEKIYMYYQRDYQRLDSHAKLLKNTSKKVKWGYIFKMILLVVVAIIQVAILIKPFSSLKEQYQTV